MNPPPLSSLFVLFPVDEPFQRQLWILQYTPSSDQLIIPPHSTPLLHQGCVDEAAASAAAPAAAKLVGTEPQDLCLVLDLSQLPYSSLFMKK